jgi:rare lipoprotein A
MPTAISRAALGALMMFPVLALPPMLAPPPADAAVQCGSASWYAMTSRTASGERADPNIMAAAHRTLPFGTKVRVENLRNGRSVVVRINDRGPFARGRVIDVTRSAADQLGFRNAGHAPVRITVVEGSSRTGGSC